jgi:hypothetical protein
VAHGGIANGIMSLVLDSWTLRVMSYKTLYLTTILSIEDCCAASMANEVSEGSGHVYNSRIWAVDSYAYGMNRLIFLCLLGTFAIYVPVHE